MWWRRADRERPRAAFFAGAKEVALLDRYEAQGGVPRFDRAIDFGWFYFLTKPIFLTLDFFYHLIGNFGLAIMLLTVIIKLLFFPLANKSYRAMSKMKLLQPEMAKLREKFGDDKQKLNQEMMALYKRVGANPMAGCLPIVIQIPVFFSLYKVLYVTIEMRHAPFYGWIHDLSAPDPTTFVNLFGLLPFTPPDISFLHIGAWPLIMGVHHVPAAEAQSAAARSDAGEDVHDPAGRVHLHAGAVRGRAGDLLELEQPALDRAAMADHAPRAAAKT